MRGVALLFNTITDIFYHYIISIPIHLEHPGHFSARENRIAIFIQNAATIKRFYASSKINHVQVVQLWPHGLEAWAVP